MPIRPGSVWTPSRQPWDPWIDTPPFIPFKIATSAEWAVSGKHTAIEDSLNQLVKAWSGRNWQTIILLTRELFKVEITLFSAERNDDGKIEFKKLHRQPCKVLLSVFPQCYTLFWQYVWRLNFHKYHARLPVSLNPLIFFPWFGHRVLCQSACASVWHLWT